MHHSARCIVLLLLQHKGFRYTEALVIMLVGTVGICFTAEIVFSRPDYGGNFIRISPKIEILQNPEMLYIAIGILGSNSDATQLIFALLNCANARLAT